MKFDIKMTGDKETIKAFNDLSKKAKSQVLKRGLDVGSKIVLTAARDGAPIESGKFKSSLGVKISAARAKAYIGSDLDYASVIELGAPGRKISPRPVLRPALYGNRSAVRAAFIEEIKNATREVGLNEKIKAASAVGTRVRAAAKAAKRAAKLARKQRIREAKQYNRRAKSNKRLERKANRLLKRLK